MHMIRTLLTPSCSPQTESTFNYIPRPTYTSSNSLRITSTPDACPYSVEPTSIFTHLYNPPSTAILMAPFNPTTPYCAFTNSTVHSPILLHKHNARHTELLTRPLHLHNLFLLTNISCAMSERNTSKYSHTWPNYPLHNSVNSIINYRYSFSPLHPAQQSPYWRQILPYIAQIQPLNWTSPVFIVQQITPHLFLIQHQYYMQ